MCVSSYWGSWSFNILYLVVLLVNRAKCLIGDYSFSKIACNTLDFCVDFWSINIMDSLSAIKMFYVALTNSFIVACVEHVLDIFFDKCMSCILTIFVTNCICTLTCIPVALWHTTYNTLSSFNINLV